MATHPITVTKQEDRWNVDYGDGNEQNYTARDQALLAANDAGARDGRNVQNNTSAEGE